MSISEVKQHEEFCFGAIIAPLKKIKFDVCFKIKFSQFSKAIN
jgi:hypothetical protein